MSKEVCLACHKEWSKFYKDHTCDETTKLKKALEIANTVVKLSCHIRSEDEAEMVEECAKEAQKQIQEIMESK